MVETIESEDLLDDLNDLSDDLGDLNDFDDPKLSDKVFCANCQHCKLVRVPTENGTKFHLRVRCDAGKWRKKLGEEKLYKYFTVARRSLDKCDAYEQMGDVRDFLRELKKTLPIKDEAYSY